MKTNIKTKYSKICRSVGTLKSWGTATASLFSVCVLLGNTSCDEQSAEVTLGEDSSMIIGGYEATHAIHNHTGALVIGECGGENISEFCTGTLISPEVVITAKHCTEIAGWGYEIYFAIGPDTTNPIEVIPVADYEMGPSDGGGFVGMGKDVGVFYLDHPPATDITPITPRPSSELQVGDRMVNLGYGVFSGGNMTDDKRRIGRETVAGVQGLVFEAMFGDFESFLEWLFTGQVTDEDYLENVSEEDIEWAQEIYESEQLMEGNEVVTGVGPNDTQSCYGDSGGPLMKYIPGTGYVTYGVVSGGLNSWRLPCDFGTVFSTFDQEVMDFLAASEEWEDPCGEVPQTGICTNNIVLKCETDLLTGVREVTTQACADGNICVELEDGSAACAIPPGTYAAAEPEDRDGSGSCEADGESVCDAIAEMYLSKSNEIRRWQP